jgi:hypothetical protein
MENLINITETTINNSKTISEIAKFFNTSLFEVELIISEAGFEGVNQEVELEDGLNYVVFKIRDTSTQFPNWEIEVLHLDFFS